MNTRCYRCGWSFSLGREALIVALDTAQASGAKNHMERCPRCRQVIKISVDQLRRAAPGWRPSTPAQATASAVDEPSQAAPDPVAPPAEPSEAQNAPLAPKRKSAAKKKAAA